MLLLKNTLSQRDILHLLVLPKSCQLFPDFCDERGTVRTNNLFRNDSVHRNCMASFVVSGGVEHRSVLGRERVV